MNLEDDQMSAPSACPGCGAENRDGAKFCRKCGGALALATNSDLACPACGTENSGSAKFCRGCGISLQTTTEPAPKATASELGWTPQHTPANFDGSATFLTRSPKQTPMTTLKQPWVIALVAMMALACVGAGAFILMYRSHHPPVADAAAEDAAARAIAAADDAASTAAAAQATAAAAAQDAAQTAAQAAATAAAATQDAATAAAATQDASTAAAAATPYGASAVPAPQIVGNSGSDPNYLRSLITSANFSSNWPQNAGAVAGQPINLRMDISYANTRDGDVIQGAFAIKGGAVSACNLLKTTSTGTYSCNLTVYGPGQYLLAVAINNVPAASREIDVPYQSSEISPAAGERQMGQMPPLPQFNPPR